MQNPLKEETEESLQSIAIESLAAEFALPVAQVRRAYEQQVDRLKSDARIRDFLSVFALRNTRETLRRASG